MRCLVKGKRKEPLFNGSLNYTGSETFCADVEFAGLSASDVDAYGLNVNKPAASCVAV